MLIQPVQPVMILIKYGSEQFECQMVSLSNTELEISCKDYLEMDSVVKFSAQYFRGEAIIRDIKFAQYNFSYKMEISEIRFQPGLVINTRL